MAKRTCGGRWHWSALLSTFLGDLREEQGLYDPLSFLLGEWVCSDQLLGRTGPLPCGKRVLSPEPMLLLLLLILSHFSRVRLCATP